MSRFNKKQLSIAKVVEQQRAGIRPQPIPTTVLTSEQSADRYGKTDSFWWESVGGELPIRHWAAFQFLKRSQNKRRKLARQSA